MRFRCCRCHSHPVIVSYRLTHAVGAHLLHRLKRPVGRRLAIAAVNLIPEYRSISPLARSQTAKTGPTLAGCSLTGLTATGETGQGSSTRTGNNQLQLHFNASLLGDESLLLRPWDTDMRNWASKTQGTKTVTKADSAGLMVCTAP